MNQNISFHSKPEPRAIFKLDVTKKMPFHFYEAYTTTSTLNNKETKIYCCEVGAKNVFVRNGDFIVIFKDKEYLDGQMKDIEVVRVYTASHIQLNFEAYDELNQEYLDDIMDAFEDVSDEPTIEELQAIDNDIDRIIYEGTHLKDILDDETLINSYDN